MTTNTQNDQKRIRRRWFLAVGASLFVVFALASWFCGSHLVAPANRQVGPPPNSTTREVRFENSTGNVVNGWLAERDSSVATILLLHPIRADRRAMMTRANLLFEAGFSVLLIDQQAHGETHGEQITLGYREKEDVAAAIDFLREHRPDHRIGVIGWSLGGAAAVLASPMHIDALVLESVYPTIEKAVQNRLAMKLGNFGRHLSPALLWQIRPRLGVSASQLRPIDNITRLGCPLLVLAGDEDKHTTIEESRQLYECAQAPKKLSVFKGAGHTDLFRYAPQQYSEQVLGFLQKHLNANAD